MRRFAFAIAFALVPGTSPLAAAVAPAAPRTEPPPIEEPSFDHGGASLTEAEAPKTPRKVHLRKNQITVTIARLAERYLSHPMGSETIKVIDGKRYSFCVEEHFHAPGSGLTPEGWHKGVTVYGYEE